MNKQAIEKMATIIACGDCGCASWDCPNDEGIKCYAKEKAKSTANLLVRNGYINGADFVEWLCKEFSSNGDFISADKEAILEALQEYQGE